MRVALHKNLRGIQRPLLFHDAVNKQTVVAPEKDHVTAAQCFRAHRADHRDVSWANPGHHACAMNAKRDAPARRQRFRNPRNVARASLTAYLV
jgi:hypothetical protein